MGTLAYLHSFDQEKFVENIFVESILGLARPTNEKV